MFLLTFSLEEKMKRFFGISLFLFAFTAICSCSSVSTVSVSRETKLSPEAMRVWSRPIEIGFQVAGVIEGKADNKSRDVVSAEEAAGMKLNLFSKNPAVDVEKLSPVAKLAAFNAIKAAMADGMIITMVKEEKSGSTKTAWVKGIALKLVIYDEVSEERSDAFRYCQLSCEQGNCQGCIRIPEEKGGKPAAIPNISGKTAKPNVAPAQKEEKPEE